MSGDQISGNWQSGPAITTLVATDNHDGTDTLTVTDNTNHPAGPAHYLRVRFSRP